MTLSETMMVVAWTGAVLGPLVGWRLWRKLRKPGRRRLAWTFAGAWAAAWVLGVWAFLVEPETLVVRHVTVEAAQWSGAPVRIGLISDTHVGAPHMSVARLKRIVARMNRERPDLVVLLGDYVGGHAPAAGRSKAGNAAVMQGMAAFSGLEAPLGVKGVLGNHEWLYDPALSRRTLAAAGVEVLENRAVEVKRPGGDFRVVGLADMDAPDRPAPRRIVAAIPWGQPVIVIGHEPNPFRNVPSRVALTLAGHTHCGQVNLPVFGRIVNASDLARRWACGLYNEAGRQIYVTGGVGTSILPVRFRAPPEIVVITLTAPKPALAPTGPAH